MRDILMNNNYVRTYTGRKFYPNDPESLEVDIEDIAHALSNVCRYNGHLIPFFSVAEHSVYVSLTAGKIDQGLQLQGLLHDASEAYLPDMPTPIKDILPDFKALEKRLQQHIFKSLNIPYPLSPTIKEIDTRIRWDEIRCMQIWNPNEGQLFNGIGIMINPLSSRDAETAFMQAYYKLISSSFGQKEPIQSS